MSEELVRVRVQKDEYWGPVALVPVDENDQSRSPWVSLVVPPALIEELDAAWVEVERIASLLSNLRDEQEDWGL